MPPGMGNRFMTKRSRTTKSTKRSSKRGSRRKKSSSHLSLYLLGGVVAVTILVVAMTLSAWVGYQMGREEALDICKNRVVGYRNDLEKLRKKLKSQSFQKAKRGTPSKSPEKRGVCTEERKKENRSEIRDYMESGGKENVALPRVKETVHLERPKLAIVIDDVAYASQIRKIRALPWHITPSLFPPTSRHPDTARIAANLDHFMIHLPMEAMNYCSPEEWTLTTKSSKEEIERRIEELRRQFPGTHFINNHTGSRFTADLSSMEKFYTVIKRHGFVFVDSRTTPKTVVPKICGEYGDPYIARDVFLDNKTDIASIRKQLEKAVEIAKSHGYAIAIGHPHATTLEAIGSSGKILQEVDIVYIDELYDKIR
ncbi:divergent polysaccharide deacetylase family protein [Hydrogenimonas sp.]